jgi:hypothetical protein
LIPEFDSYPEFDFRVRLIFSSFPLMDLFCNSTDKSLAEALKKSYSAERKSQESREKKRRRKREGEKEKEKKKRRKRRTRRSEKRKKRKKERSLSS